MEEFKKIFCENLKILRGIKKQEEIADAIGISKEAYGYYERGLREPNFETLLMLAGFFNVSIDYLFGLAHYKSEEEAIRYTYDYCDSDDYLTRELKEEGKKLLINYRNDIYEKYRKTPDEIENENLEQEAKAQKKHFELMDAEFETLTLQEEIDMHDVDKIIVYKNNMNPLEVQKKYSGKAYKDYLIMSQKSFDEWYDKKRKKRISQKKALPKQQKNTDNVYLDPAGVKLPILKENGEISYEKVDISVINKKETIK